MTNLIQKLRTTLENRRAYNRAVAEIAKIDEHELADLRTHRDILLAHAYRNVYGAAR